ncbi:MAG: hypothetical protein KC561_12215, partial [Myxococcales bacterium]|nr:hypothetical protein [Myxococcales bacterium]
PPTTAEFDFETGVFSWSGGDTGTATRVRVQLQWNEEEAPAARRWLVIGDGSLTQVVYPELPEELEADYGFTSGGQVTNLNVELSDYSLFQRFADIVGLGVGQAVYYTPSAADWWVNSATYTLTPLIIIN